MKEEIIKISKNVGIDVIGFCNTKKLIIDYKKYELQDELSYKSSFQVGSISSKDLSALEYKDYNTAIVIGVGYNRQLFDDKNKVYFSSCSIGLDYHILLKEKLESIKLFLDKYNYISKIFVDNNPLDERVLAYNAGLGFFGKNNLLINEKLGSCFYIGVILTDAVIEPSKIINSKCSMCNLCKNICPMGAINESGILDSNKCMSYITQKKDINEKVYKCFDNCIYGCDKCINVCPYNNKIKTESNPVDPYEFLNLSNQEYKNKYSNTSSSWRGKKVIDRNINIYLNNLKNK